MGMIGGGGNAMIGPIHLRAALMENDIAEVDTQGTGPVSVPGPGDGGRVRQTGLLHLGGMVPGVRGGVHLPPATAGNDETDRRVFPGTDRVRPQDERTRTGRGDARFRTITL